MKKPKFKKGDFVTYAPLLPHRISDPTKNLGVIIKVKRRDTKRLPYIVSWLYNESFYFVKGNLYPYSDYEIILVEKWEYND